MKREIDSKCQESMTFFIDVQFPYVDNEGLAAVVKKELRDMNCDIDIRVIKDEIRKYSNNGKEDEATRFY
ncbi:MAG: hypothetical protein ACP5K9_01020 [Candidatus Micrarchaeia archaeon]